MVRQAKPRNPWCGSSVLRASAIQGLCAHGEAWQGLRTPQALSTELPACAPLPPAWCSSLPESFANYWAPPHRLVCRLHADFHQQNIYSDKNESKFKVDECQIICTFILSKFSQELKLGLYAAPLSNILGANQTLRVCSAKIISVPKSLFSNGFKFQNMEHHQTTKLPKVCQVTFTTCHWFSCIENELLKPPWTYACPCMPVCMCLPILFLQQAILYTEVLIPLGFGRGN